MIIRLRYIVLALLILGQSRADGQDFGNTEKFGKAFLKAIQKEKKDKKIISSPKVFQGIFDEMYNSLTSDDVEDKEFATEFAEQMKKFDVDSLQQELSGKVKTSMADVRSKLAEKDIELKSLEYNYVQIELEDLYPFDLISGSITLFAKSGEHDVIVTAYNCIYYEDDWYVGDNIEVLAGKYVKFCKCLEPENNQLPECVELKDNFESVYKAMSEDEKTRFQNEIAECMSSGLYGGEGTEEKEEAMEEPVDEYGYEGGGYDGEAYEEEAAEAVEDYDDDGYPEEDYNISSDEIKEMRAKLDKQFPDYCECHENHDEDEWREKCEEYGVAITTMIKDATTERDSEIILRAMACED